MTYEENFYEIIFKMLETYYEIFGIIMQHCLWTSWVVIKTIVRNFYIKGAV